MLFDSPPREETFKNVLATEDHCLNQSASLYNAIQRRENRIFDNNQPSV